MMGGLGSQWTVVPPSRSVNASIGWMPRHLVILPVRPSDRGWRQRRRALRSRQNQHWRWAACFPGERITVSAVLGLAGSTACRIFNTTPLASRANPMEEVDAGQDEWSMEGRACWYTPSEK